MSRILAVIMVFLLVSCVGNKKVIKVGSSMVLTSSGIFLAQELGFFKEEGLEVEIIPFKESGAPMTVLLAEGVLDIGGGNFSSGLFRAIQEGNKLKIVADKGNVNEGQNYISVLIRKDLLDSGKVKEVKDLKGLRFGFTALNGVSQQVALDKLLATEGLSIEDVKSFRSSYPMMNISLKNGDLDGAVQLEPYVTMAEMEGYARKFITVHEVHPNQQSAGIIFSQNFLKDRREDGVKFMKAYLKGVRVYEAAFMKNKDKDKIINLLKKYIPIENDEVWHRLTPSGINPNGEVLWAKLEEDINWYASKKYIPSTLNKDEVVDTFFVEAALKEIGMAP